MKRLILSGVIALTLHAVLIFISFKSDVTDRVEKPEIRFMSMNLCIKESVIEKKKAVQPPVKRKPIPVKKKIIKKEQVKKKENVICKPVEHKEPEPAATEVADNEPVDLKEKPEDRKPDSSEGAVSLIREAYPLYRFNPSPSYPRTARLRKWQGVVQLEVLVDREGNVKELEVLKSSGYSLLDRSAVKTVKNWRFEPARKGDEAIEMTVIVPIRFRLDHA